MRECSSKHTSATAVRFIIWKKYICGISQAKGWVTWPDFLHRHTSKRVSGYDRLLPRGPKLVVGYEIGAGYKVQTCPQPGKSPQTTMLVGLTLAQCRGDSCRFWANMVPTNIAVWACQYLLKVKPLQRSSLRITCTVHCTYPDKLIRTHLAEYNSYSGMKVSSLYSIVVLDCSISIVSELEIVALRGSENRVRWARRAEAEIFKWMN